MRYALKMPTKYADMTDSEMENGAGSHPLLLIGRVLEVTTANAYYMAASGCVVGTAYVWKDKDLPVWSKIAITHVLGPATAYFLGRGTFLMFPSIPKALYQARVQFPPPMNEFMVNSL